jgi:hypothetical protein
MITNGPIILLNRLGLLIIKQTKLRARTVPHAITRDINLITTSSRLGALVVEAKVRLGRLVVARLTVFVRRRGFGGEGRVVVHLPVGGKVLGAVLVVDGLGDVAEGAVVAVGETLVVVVVARHVVVVQALALVGDAAFGRGLRLARGGGAVVFEFELVAGAGAGLVDAFNADGSLLDLWTVSTILVELIG